MRPSSAQAGPHPTGGCSGAEVIEDLEEQSAYDYLKRLTDIHRLHLFDVVMQYRAIFSDDNSVQVQSAVKTHFTLSIMS